MIKDTGSDLSFALALLDENNNGVLLNGIYSREMSNIYAKPVTKGESSYTLSIEEKQAIDDVVLKGVTKGQSINHIVATNKDTIKCSSSTVYRMINERKTLTQRLDLRRAVKLKPRRHYIYKEDNKAIREGRKYYDFLREYNRKPFTILTEMDTVEGPKNQPECLLTLHITNTHFMIAKLLPKQTKECVTNAFKELKQELGLELYKKLFACILTDRGTEFCDPEAIEIDPLTGEKIANVYFCNSYASYQKGAIEENHTLIRYILPKGSNFGRLSQDKIDLMMSHINSYYRKSIDAIPYELTEALLGTNDIEKTKVRPITPDSVVVTPKLLK